MNDTAFEHRQSAHCETGVMSSMLRHYGADISEPMALGLSSGIAFAYIPFVKLNGLPLIAYRMPPGWIIRRLRKRLGIDIRFERFSNPERGMAALDARLSDSTVVGMQTSVFWLPYFPDEMRFHFNAHNLIGYGRDGDDYLISDPVFEEPVRCPAPDLRRARFVKGALAPKGMMYTIERMPERLDLEAAIPKAIRANVRIMYTPLPFIGLRGIRFLAGRIRKLDKTLGDPHRIALYLGHIVRMQEEIGTGGAGFRFIYASFLQEAGERINRPELFEASQMMTAAGDQWREFALETVKMCKQRSKLDLKGLSDVLLQTADEEEKVWRFLKGFKG